MYYPSRDATHWLPEHWYLERYFELAEGQSIAGLSPDLRRFRLERDPWSRRLRLRFSGEVGRGHPENPDLEGTQVVPRPCPKR